MKVTRKLIIPSLILLLVITLGIITIDVLTTLSNAEQQEQEKLVNLENVFLARLDALKAFSTGLALEAANNPEIQAAFAQGDRARLVELTLPAYKALDTQFDIPQHQFHLPPATSFLRLHQLDQFGDDLSSFRFTVLAANDLKQPLAGLEIGRGGLGVRGLAPVAYEGQHLGTVEFGLNVDQPLINQLQSEFGGNWQIFLRREPAEIATFVGATGETAGPIPDLLFQVSTFSEPLFGQTEAYEKAIQGEAVFSQVTLTNQAYTFYTVPLRDYSGNVIGVLDIALDRTPLIQAIIAGIFSAVGVLGLAMGLMALGLAFVATRTLRPIAELEKSAAAMAQGDLNQEIKITSNDEIGTLATTFNQMATQLRSLIGGLEQRVADRTRALNTSAEVSRYLSTILDPQRLVLEVVEVVKASFNYYHAHIYLLQEDGQTLKMVGGTGAAGRELLARGHTVSLDRGLVGRAARTRQTILVPDTQADPHWLPNPLLPETKSEIAVPLIFGEKLLGVLDVQHNILNGLTEADAELLQSVASQTAIALQNAAALKVAEERTETVRQSQELFQTILETAPVPFLMSSMTDGTVLYANEQLGNIFGLLVSDLIGRQTPDFYYDPAERANLIGKVRQEGYVKDYELHVKKADGTPFWVSASLQPIKYLNSPALLAAFYDLTSRKTVEEKLAKRAARDRILNRISTKIRGAVSMDQVLQVAVQEVRQATGAARSIAIIDPNEETMSFPPVTDQDLRVYETEKRR